MKLDAADPLILTVVTAQIGSSLHSRRIYFATCGRFGIPQHLEIILENINDFI